MFWGTLTLIVANQMWVKNLEPKHRLRLSDAIVSAVPWLTAGEPTNAWASIGTLGQLVISPSVPLQDTRKIFDQTFNSERAQVDENSEDELSLAPLLASAWPVKFLVETGRSRMSLVLPKEARELGIVPDDRQPVVVHVVGTKFYIWKTKEWVEHVRATRSSLDSITERLSEDQDVQ